MRTARHVLAEALALCARQPVRPVPPAMLDNRPWWRAPLAPPCAWATSGDHYQFAVTLGACEALSLKRRRTRRRLGLVVCHVHPDCRPSLTIALRCALDGAPAQVAR